MCLTPAKPHRFVDLQETLLKNENVGFTREKKKKKNHISRLKKHPGPRNEVTPCPLSFSGPLGFHIYLGPCVWAPGSCEDHVALPLQPQLQTHMHTNAQTPFKDGTLVVPGAELPSPLTWLSNYLKPQQGHLNPLHPFFPHPLTPAHTGREHP